MSDPSGLEPVATFCDACAAAVAGVPSSGFVGGVPQFIQVTPADPAVSLVGERGVGGMGQQAGDGRTEGSEGEAPVAEELPSVHGSPVGRGDANGVGGVASEIQPHIWVSTRPRIHADFLDSDRPAQAFPQCCGQDSGTRPRGVIPQFT
ncbi:hypothetical protein [Streptomyces sp. NPDC051994]|uniref:hypothetical protein n=1 Tax=unclassified Streptomyces TaxID=2593676 RepID=UPI00342A9A37